MSVAKLDINADSWWSVNDGVMGGVSAGGIRKAVDSQGVIFTGVLSLENNGGFSSVRKSVDMNVSNANSVRFKIRGDGREYQFRIRQSDQFDGIAWRKSFMTNGEWQEIEIPLDVFEPVWRGRIVPEAGPVMASGIRQIGFLLADKKEGPFSLEIDSIEFIALDKQPVP